MATLTILNSKICPTCEQNKELSEYYTKIREDGSIYYRRECKKCVAIRSQKWEKENPEAYSISRNKKESQPARIKYRIEDGARQRKSGYHVEWSKKNPEKCREYTRKHRIHDITENEWRKELEVFNYECAYCGMTQEKSKIIHNQKLHKEHVDCNGYNDLRNAVPACRSCNSIKHEDSLDEWYNDEWYNKDKKFFTKERYDKIIWWITEGYKDYIEDKLPYIIRKKKDIETGKFYHHLWSVDEMRNTIDILATEVKKRDLDIHIERLFPNYQSN